MYGENENMPILGIESVVYGVEDLALCNRFWADYGLIRSDEGASDGPSEWTLPSGSRMIMRAIDDPSLPAAYFPVRVCANVSWVWIRPRRWSAWWPSWRSTEMCAAMLTARPISSTRMATRWACAFGPSAR
jgi:hypothetical protein